MKRTCKQCGKEFVITQSEINFYKSKNLSIPKRCKECRQSNKQNNKNRSANASRQESYVPAAPQRKAKSTPVTTAVTIALVVLAIVYAIFFKEPDSTPSSSDSSNAPVSVTEQTDLEFRNDDLLYEHYEKHGREMGFTSAEDYEEAASDVVENSEALQKTEAEDGDMVYYLENTNEFVIVSPDGYIRTYFLPEDGIDYYNRQ